MKTQKFNFESDKIIQIYINQKEKSNEEIVREINNIKSKNPNVFIFSSGDNDTVKTLKEILNYQKNRKD